MPTRHPLLAIAALLIGGCGRPPPQTLPYPSTPPPPPRLPAAAPPSAAPPSAAVRSYAVRVRSTFYHAHERHSDPDTDAGRSATGVPLREATATRAGVCAVDPAVIPYGSRIVVPTADGPRTYVAADTGVAVRRRTAAGGRRVVIDFYSRTQVGEETVDVTVVPYAGTVPFMRLSAAHRAACADQPPANR